MSSPAFPAATPAAAAAPCQPATPVADAVQRRYREALRAGLGAAAATEEAASYLRCLHPAWPASLARETAAEYLQRHALPLA